MICALAIPQCHGSRDAESPGFRAAQWGCLLYLQRLVSSRNLAKAILIFKWFHWRNAAIDLTLLGRAREQLLLKPSVLSSCVPPTLCRCPWMSSSGRCKISLQWCLAGTRCAPCRNYTESQVCRVITLDEVLQGCMCWNLLYFLVPTFGCYARPDSVCFV